MIRVSRRRQAPAVLRRLGPPRRREHEQEYARTPKAFQDGSKQFNFDRDIYAHKTVKAALIADQHEKCAFCEAKPLAVSDGDVEHFRPKAAVRQTDADPLDRPGYYWLAYEWSNLLFSCERCNRRHKKNQFPLFDLTARAQRLANLDLEQPVYIDPARENPADHIAFRDHIPIATNGSIRGDWTIEALGLRRRPLCEDREQHLERLRAVFILANLPQTPKKEKQRAASLLKRMTAKNAEYALMSITAVQTWRTQSQNRSSTPQKTTS